jgi:phosphatidylserine/phosphatidylglycerophosphate/cardiolipin synthase-like enzyme
MPGMMSKFIKQKNFNTIEKDEDDDDDDDDNDDEEDEKEDEIKINMGSKIAIKLRQNAFLINENDINEKMDFNIQALRSGSLWSIGKNITERSILQGYYKLIDNSKHYIYIENQFFITRTYTQEDRRDSGINLNRLVQNEIGLHIKSRIERAYEANENFKVFICIPLLPGFSGIVLSTYFNPSSRPIQFCIKTLI